jgi:isoamylase/glycogen operon protein
LKTKTATKGKPKPLGAYCRDDGVNFAIFSNFAESVSLCLLDDNKSIETTIPMQRTGDIWHLFIPDLKLPHCYAYKINGQEKFLSDPYAKLLDVPLAWGENKPYFPFPIAAKEAPFDWQGTQHPKIPLKDLVIYEMHVRGFTRHPSSKVENPGTFLGVIEKIPHLKHLGVNAIELMPAFEFNECEYDKLNPITKQRLYNYWGYSSLSFFAPMRRFASTPDAEKASNEFRTMVRELHRNGIEVILDVVYNHTGEKGHAYSFLGLDRNVYYLIDDNGNDVNISGCGNTVNVNNPLVRQLIRDSLSYWVTEMGVDGFRFDLASVMNRDKEGKLLEEAPLIESLTYEAVLADTKLIAEPWDAIGGYQLGGFHPKEHRWAEWNGQYRDAVRGFIKGDEGSKNSFAARLAGSRDVFPNRLPQSSINFVTAHDGFSLEDLVSYNEKHNEQNGEDNRDGSNSNYSWNCGVEGKTNEPGILGLRRRQMRNLMLALMVSQGVPMILMGDEYGHTKQGNNNTWCQDNDLSWFCWDKLKNDGFYRYMKALIAFRQSHEMLRQEQFLNDDTIQWHGVVPFEPDWDSPTPILGFTLVDHVQKESLYVIFNATGQAVEVELPPPYEGKKWHRIVDTFAVSPNDIVEESQAPEIENSKYIVSAYSSLLFKSLSVGTH